MKALLLALAVLTVAGCTSSAQPPGPLAVWRVVGKWRGASSGKTALFSVPHEWRIVYNCPPGGTVISVYDADGRCRDVVTAKGIGVSYEHAMGGRVYLDFLSGYPPGPYSVQVQALDR